MTRQTTVRSDDVTGPPTADIEAQFRQRTARVRLVGRIRDFSILGVTVALAIILAISTDTFLTVRNLLNMLEQWGPVSMAVAGTIILISGGFDLSVGAAFALSGVVTVMLAENSGSVPLGVIAGILCGTVLGVINGLLTTVGRMNVFVGTLATSIVFSGLAAALTGGMVLVVRDPAFGFARKDLLGVNITIWVFLIVIAIGSFVMTRTTFGRFVTAVGSKEEAALLAGVRVTRVRIVAFGIAGTLIGIAAVLMTSRGLSVNAVALGAVAFNVWTAMLLGGNSVRGGEGAIWRTVVGVVLLALIGNGFVLMRVEPLYQQVVTGMILLAAIAIDVWTRKSSTQ